MDIYKQKFTILQQEILRFLYIKTGLTFNSRELARQLHVSATAIIKSLPKLEKERMILVKKDQGRFVIELNRQNTGLKRAENIKLLYESGLVDHLSENFPGCTIIVFGSYSYGEDVFSSDIDIAIIGSKKKNINLDKYSKILGKNISLNGYEDLKIDNNLLQNLVNGIILKGYIEI